MGGSLCCSKQAVRAFGEDQSMFAEQLAGKKQGLRPVEVWTPESGRTKYLEELAAKDQTKAKVNRMAMDHVQDRCKVKISNLAAMPRLHEILKLYVAEVYDYILKHNVAKFAKSDLKMREYVEFVNGRCFIRVLEEHNASAFAPGATAQEIIAHYAKLTLPGADLTKGDACSHASRVVSQAQRELAGHFLLAGVICPLYANDPYQQRQMYADPYWHEVAQEFLGFMGPKYKSPSGGEAGPYKAENSDYTSELAFSESTIRDLRSLRVKGEKMVLRTLNWKDYTGAQLAKHYNLILEGQKEARAAKPGIASSFADVNSQDFEQNWQGIKTGLQSGLAKDEEMHREKDDKNTREIEQIANGMLDLYRWHQDTSKVGIPEFNEIVALSAIKHPGIYRQIVQNVVYDIGNDPLINPHKYSGLSAIILNLHTKQEEIDNGQEFLSNDDLASCLNLLKSKYSTMLVDTTSIALQECVDAFNLILSIMVQIGLTGVREETVAEITESQVVFEKVCTHRDPAPVRMLGFDAYEGVDISLLCKAKFTAEALFRVGKARPAWTQAATRQMQFDQACTAVLGVASVVKGVASFDMASVMEGAGKLGPIIMFYARDRSWYDTVDVVRSLVATDFELFKKTFFDNTYGDPDNKARDDKIKKMQDQQSFRTVTYYVMDALDRTVADTTRDFETRMECISLLRYLLENKNLENGSKLMYSVNVDTTFMIKHKLLLYTQMRDDANVDPDQADELRRYARLMLNSTYKDTPEADEHVEGLVKQNRKSIRDADRSQDNQRLLSRELLRMSLAQKVPVQHLLSELQAGADEAYMAKVAPLHRVDVHASERHNHNLLDGHKPVLLFPDAVEEFLRSQQHQVMLLQGGAGSGKTTLLRHIERDLWRTYKRGEAAFFPVMVSLAGLKETGECLQHAMRAFNYGEPMVRTLRDADDVQVVMLLDGFDEMRQPTNLYDANDYASWMGDIKVIVTSRTETLEAYQDYTKFFAPRRRADQLVEYLIEDVGDQQIEQYVKQMYEQSPPTRPDAHPIVAADPHAKKLEQFAAKLSMQKFEKHLITKLARFKDIIRTPYMMRIVVDIMPDLDKMADQRGGVGDEQRDADVSREVVYEAFTRQFFGRKMRELLRSEPEDLPPGYDLMQSFYNYSCSLATAMWVDGRQDVTAQSSNFPYPKFAAEPTDAKYAKYFGNDPTTRHARAGSLVDVDGHTARFQHRSIQDYFVARVLFEALKHHNPKKRTIASTHLNARVIDPEKDAYVLRFLAGMVGEHIDKCRRLHGEDAKSQSAHCPMVDVLAAIVDEAADGGTENYKRNAMAIASRVPEVFGRVTLDDGDVVRQVCQSRQVPRAFKVTYCWAAAKAFREHDQDEEHCAEFQQLALGFMLGGAAAYSGDSEKECLEASPNGPADPLLSVKIKAHGAHGELRYENGDVYTGNWVKNQRQGMGKVEYFQPDRPDESQIVAGVTREGDRALAELAMSRAKRYHGQFKEDQRHGEGKLVYADGNGYYVGEWVRGERSGAGERQYGGGAMYYGQWKNDRRDGQGSYFDETQQFLCEGNWCTGQLSGNCSVTFGGTSRLANLRFEGTFVNNDCASGTLRLGPGEKDFIKGSLRLVLGKDTRIRFYTEAELAAGLDKFWVVSLGMDGDQVSVKKFARHGEATSLYAGTDLTLGEEVRAKLQVGDREVLRKAGPEAELAKVAARAEEDGIVEGPAEAYPEFASKFGEEAHFDQIVADKAARVGSFAGKVELGDDNSD